MYNPTMPSTPATDAVIASLIRNFQSQKRLADKAVEQLSDAQLRQPLDENTNSVAVIMKHVAGNLRSRFTDFLTTDGEKPDRNRDGEFVDDFPDRAAIVADWETGWKILFDALASLEASDLARVVTIRGEPHAVIDALHRSLAHCGYHAGQIVQLARFLAKDNWQTITIPRGGSQAFNQQMKSKQEKLACARGRMSPRNTRCEFALERD
jgi:hypothetical protein